MSEHIEILNEIKRGGYEASLITTFNAYLSFYEDVVLRHLMVSGVRHNVLMMDATQASLAVDRHPPRFAGRYYTLAPIKVSGAFHPKIILLVGKRKGTLLVGSHNLTLSGFGYNREMSNLIQYSGEEDVEAAAIFNSVWQSVLSWGESHSNPLPDQIIDMIRRVQDFAPWLQGGIGKPSENCRVLSSKHDAASLWEQLIEFAGTEPIKRAIISGAFFDANLSFIQKIRDELSPEELIVGIDPESVQFPVGKKLSGVSFVNCNRLAVTENDNKQGGYLHAKSVLIQRGSGETVLAVGSANPSYPAWLAPGITQNVEMMVARKGEGVDEVAEKLGLTAILSMPPLTDEDWALAKLGRERNDESRQNDPAAKIVIALAIDDDIRFRLPGTTLPPVINCEITTLVGHSVTRQARLAGGEYILSTEGINVPASLFCFRVGDKSFTGLIHHIKLIEESSRTGSQRKFNEALASLITDMPNLEHFVECIKDVIKISDKIATTLDHPRRVQRKLDNTPEDNREGAELSIGLSEVVERNHLRKQRLRGSDDLGYLLDVLLYNLRDKSPIDLNVATEERDAKGRSEEEQIDADDEESVIEPPQATTSQNNNTPGVPVRSALDVCHYKVGSLVSMACDKMDAFRQGELELAQFVVIMAAILSALRLLRGLDNKVPWIGAGQTAVPETELRKYFDKIAEVAYDGDKSLICLDSKYSHLANADEFAPLKGLIIWLAWESGISLTKEKPFNESMEERTARFDVNRLYVATAQLIAGDENVIREARQSIGQFSSTDMDWLERLLAVDRLFRDACAGSTMLQNGSMAKTGDFGFNPLRPEIGVREVLSRGTNDRPLSFHNTSRPRFIFPAESIRTIPFETIFNASQTSIS